MAEREPVLQQLTVRYLAGLAVVLLVALVGHAIFRLGLDRRSGDLALLADAVQQRARGLEVVARAAGLRQVLGEAAARARADELGEVLRDLERAQQDLHAGRVGRGMVSPPGTETARLLRRIEPRFRALHAVGRVVVAATLAVPETIERTDVLPTTSRIHHEGRAFARGMTAVIAAARDEAGMRAAGLRRLQLVVLAVLLAGLALQAYFVYRPGLAEVRGAIEAVRAQAADAERRGEELAARIAEIERDLAAATAASQGKFGYLAGLSRDLRTRMASIVGMASLVHETDLTPEQRDYLEGVRSSADRLEALVNDVLDLTELEAGKFALASEPLRLRAVLGAALAPVARQAGAKGVDLVCRIPGDLPDVFSGDVRRVQQVLGNLLALSIESTRVGEVVLAVEAVTGEDGRERVAFEITDTGEGFPADVERALGGGSGAVETTRLGLGVTARLAGLMGAPLAIGKATGQGSRIRCVLELARVGRAEPEPPLRDLAGTRAVVIAGREAIRAAVAEMLRGFAMEVATGEDVAAAAAELADGEGPAVVVVDARLGGHTPEDILRALRENPVLAQGRVVFLVPAGAREVAALCEGRQAVVLTTPALPVPLRDAVRTAMAASEEHDEGAATEAAATDETGMGLADDRPAGDTPGRLEVLVADDNAVNRLVLVTMLEKQGHRVVAAEDGAAALAAIDEGDFDLVLLDVEMPEMDGCQVTAEIRDRERRRGTRVPVVAVTAGALEGERDRCLAAGMDAFLAKPVKSAQLAAVIATLRPGAASPWPDPLPDVPLDAERLDAAFALDVVRQFDQDARRLLGVLRDGVAAGEPGRVTRAAIRLRAMLGALGAWPAYAPAWRLETVGRSGGLAGAADLLALVEGKVAELQEALQIVATGDATAAPAAGGGAADPDAVAATAPE